MSIAAQRAELHQYGVAAPLAQSDVIHATGFGSRTMQEAVKLAGYVPDFIKEQWASHARTCCEYQTNGNVLALRSVSPVGKQIINYNREYRKAEKAFYLSGMLKTSGERESFMEKFVYSAEELIRRKTMMAGQEAGDASVPRPVGNSGGILG